MTKSCQYVKQSLLLKQHAYVTLINVIQTSAIKNYLNDFSLSHAWLMSRLTSASTTIKMKYSIWSMLLQFIHSQTSCSTIDSLDRRAIKILLHNTNTHRECCGTYHTQSYSTTYILHFTYLFIYFFLISIGIFFNMQSLHKTNAYQMVIYEISIANSHFLNSIFVVLGQLRGYF